MLLELTSAAFFMITGLILAGLSFQFKAPYNAPFLLASGIVWLVLGAFTLTGQVIEAVPYSYGSFSYTTVSGQLVLNAINQTTTYTPLISSSDPLSVATAGVFGFAMIGIGLVAILFAMFQALDWYALERKLKDEEARRNAEELQ